MTLLGYQVVQLGILAKSISFEKNILVEDKFVRSLSQRFTLEKGIALGLVLFFIGFAINFYILISWIAGGFGELHRVREALLGLILIVMGIQTIFSSFILSMLHLEMTKDK
jgi:hypothetical protein